MRMFKIKIALMTSLWLAASGCVSDDREPAPTTSAVRGVATYDVASSASRTSVVGRDSQGHEVLRVDVTHGRIPVTDDIREFYPRLSEVDGRRFDVYLEGENVWLWTVAGYEGRYTLPSPSGDPRVRAFLQEPHVKAVLDEWRLGFDVPAAAEGEEAYSGGVNTGTSPVQCTGTTCGNPRTGGNAISMCGTSVVAKSAVRMTHTGPAGTEWIVTQFCPSGSGGKAWDWVATKYCPTDAATQGTCAAGQKQSSCGCVTVSDPTDLCNSCSGANEASFYGSVTWNSSAATYSYFKLNDTIGYWHNGGANNYFNANSSIIMGQSATMNMYMPLNWSQPTNCSGAGSTGNCGLGWGTIYGASQSNGYSLFFNGHS